MQTRQLVTNAATGLLVTESMRIVLCSTYPPQQCGIATYCQALAEAFRDQGHEVIILSERLKNCEEQTVNGVRVIRLWKRDKSWSQQVLCTIEQLQPDIVHLQHVPDIFGIQSSVIDFFSGMQNKNIVAIITLHTVHTFYSALLERLFSIRQFYKALADYKVGVVIHQRRVAFDTLVKYGVEKQRIEVIPHGTTLIHFTSKQQARQELGIDANTRMLLVFGFIHPLKNLHTVIRSMHYLPKDLPYKLYIVGSIQNRTLFNRMYLEGLRQTIHFYSLQDKVVFHNDFVTFHESKRYFSASDLVLLPHAQRYGSASGVLHNCLAAQKPMLVSDSPKFGDIAHIVGPDFVARTFSAHSWANRIQYLLTHPEKVQAAVKKLQAYKQDSAWQQVGRNTVCFYTKMIKSQP